DEGGAGDRAVARPQLRAVGAVVGHEKELPVHVRQVVEGQTAARVDARDLDGPGGSAVALPEFGAVGLEEQRRVHDGEVVRVVGYGFHRHRAGRRPVALPELRVYVVVEGREEQGVVEVGQVAGGHDPPAAAGLKVGLDVLDHDRAGCRAVAL